ncbi:MAG: cysteine desulfuration protein SufE [Planctomycetaceae bacterium]|nr:cysteine desulfuration protein SufE [Planctomycetaceae bacterium]
MRTTTIEELLEDFEFLDSWEDRYRYIIELGDELEALDEVLRVEENRVQGCVSNVWLIASFDASSPPRISFRADSDSQLVRGLVSILIMLCNDQPAPTVLALDVEDLFTRLELRNHLSRSRSNGLFSMVKRIRVLAAQGIAQAEN